MITEMNEILTSLRRPDESIILRKKIEEDVMQLFRKVLAYISIYSVYICESLSYEYEA